MAVSTIAAAGRRYLPRGYSDFARQLGIWFGFAAVYQLARGFADRDPAKAFANGLRVIDFERNANSLYELTLQRLVDQSHALATIASWTYWNSEFTVVGLALLWVYLRRHEHFLRFRNTLLVANVIGLIGYVLLPTAPPRMFPDFGFGGVPHHDGLVQLAANPYAAFPSLHAADALIVGVMLAIICKRWWAKAFWAIWPAWVWVAVMATGNHFWVDVAGGVVVALLAFAIMSRARISAALAR
jgi:membrane-associated phospholipid phosphatase